VHVDVSDSVRCNSELAQYVISDMQAWKGEVGIGVQASMSTTSRKVSVNRSLTNTRHAEPELCVTLMMAELLMHFKRACMLPFESGPQAE
jgi:hypothetical protein